MVLELDLNKPALSITDRIKQRMTKKIRDIFTNRLEPKVFELLEAVSKFLGVHNILLLSLNICIIIREKKCTHACKVFNISNVDTYPKKNVN